eukprot:s1536_g26.t1
MDLIPPDDHHLKMEAHGEGGEEEGGEEEEDISDGDDPFATDLPDHPPPDRAATGDDIFSPLSLLSLGSEHSSRDGLGYSAQTKD